MGFGVEAPGDGESIGAEVVINGVFFGIEIASDRDQGAEEGGAGDGVQFDLFGIKEFLLHIGWAVVFGREEGAEEKKGGEEIADHRVLVYERIFQKKEEKGRTELSFLLAGILAVDSEFFAEGGEFFAEDAEVAGPDFVVIFAFIRSIATDEVEGAEELDGFFEEIEFGPEESFFERVDGFASVIVGDFVVAEG